MPNPREEEITQEEFDKLLEYSSSLPTGTTIGKRWKRKCPDGWLIGKYVPCDEEGMIGIEWTQPKIIGKDLSAYNKLRYADKSHSPGAQLILQERLRQLDEEGFSPEHDSEYQGGELLLAAESYLIQCNDTSENTNLPPGWKWDAYWWKPQGRLRNLVKAGALIAAEIDRLQREEAMSGDAAFNDRKRELSKKLEEINRSDFPDDASYQQARFNTLMERFDRLEERLNQVLEDVNTIRRLES